MHRDAALDKNTHNANVDANAHGAVRCMHNLAEAVHAYGIHTAYTIHDVHAVELREHGVHAHGACCACTCCACALPSMYRVCMCMLCTIELGEQRGVEVVVDVGQVVTRVPEVRGD